MNLFLSLMLMMYGGSELWSSQVNVDVFGTKKDLAQQIYNKYAVKIEAVEQKRVIARAHHKNDAQELKHIKALQQEIKETYHFPDVNIDSVFYPDRFQVFTTLNVCEQPMPRSKFQAYPKTSRFDLIDRMHFFVMKAVDFMVKHPEYANQLNCKDDHCLTPEHPDFQEDLTQFRQGVAKQWPLIYDTMMHDPILERRRAAIFLLPYLKRPNVEATILLALLDDKHPFIRHDALRVYGEVIAKHPEMKVDIEKISHSLRSCDSVERNKALILLNELAKQERYHKSIIYFCGAKLILLLALTQPNNHEFAYQILQKISHHHYKDSKLGLWKKWLSLQLAELKIK